MSPRRRRLVIGLCLALLAAVVVGSAWAWSRRTPQAAPVPQDRPGTVLLVSGYGGSTSSLDTLAAALRAAGRTVQVVPPVGNGTGDLTAQARGLRTAADGAVAAGAPSVDVVGYSAGGVVTRIWLSELGGSRIARRVVTLGSPHHGTEVAALAAGLTPASCPVACRQLAPGSPVLDRLATLPVDPRWVSVWTADDDVVTPPDSARLDGAVNVELQAVCPDARTAHGQLPDDPLVRGLVEQAFGPAGLTDVPAPGRCAALRAGR
jgi:triacylglycerol lipase